MKKLLQLSFLLFTFNTFSQGIEGILSTNESKIMDIKKKGLQVELGKTSPEIEEVFKTSLDKYWTATPIKYVKANEKPDASKITLVLADYQASGRSVTGKTTYSYTEMSLTNLDFGWFDNAFDNLKTNNNSYGIIKSAEDLKIFIPLYVKGFCNMYNSFYRNFAEGKSKWANAGYGNYPDSLKMSNILIPEEYLQNGLTKEIFEQIPNKEFIPLKEIGQRLKDGKTKNSSFLQIYRTIRGCQLRIIDLSSGNILFYKNFGLAISADQIGEPDKISNKEVSKIIGKMVEKMKDK